MTESLHKTKLDWPQLLQKLKCEVAALNDLEREWLKERLALIHLTQAALDKLFCKAGGVASCTGCDGTCCGCGRHHITLTNLLAYLFENEDPPAPDLNNTCPYLGKVGCVLPVERRPYNCITFFCDRIEDKMSPDECEQLRTLDRQLRSEYERVAERYPAATLRGLWIALDRVGDGQILHSPEKDVIE